TTTLVLGAVGLTSMVIYLLFTELLLPSGDTQVFNRTVTLVENDLECQKLLRMKPGARLKAYGESSENKWTRNRPISSIRKPDPNNPNQELLFMKFHVESEEKIGNVQLEIKSTDIANPEYVYLFLQVDGYKHFIISPPRKVVRIPGKTDNSGFLGIKWGLKKE
ncbi:Tim21p, partial [Ascoidea rubescens DSM 1968]